MSAPHPARPNPDALLARIQPLESERRRGRLKIFLGYAAGVGKTYAMLEAARSRRAEGVDAVVAYIETHRRAETDALLAGLEVIPRKTLAYRGVSLAEMDVDAILLRRPQLALVDEFAHTNVPGSLHPKRHLDVEDLLAAGIDVYTTLNIQHIESVHDVVAQITGVKVRETVPDTVLEQADEIEVVDLPPDELLQRLREGKVYVPDQAARAVEQFFRTGNLTALREMSLRYAAERIEGQMQTYMQAKAIAGPWAAGERLMVCIRPGRFGERLVRSARRLAGELNCEWYAVYVETHDHARLSEAERDRIAHTLHLAEALGGKTVTLAGSPLHQALLDFARANNVTRILIGRPIRPPWLEWLRPSPVNRLIRESGSIDVFVISGEPETTRAAAARAAAPTPRRLWRYAEAVLFVAAATGLGLLLRGSISPTNLMMLYLLTVIAAAARLGRGPSVMAAALGVLAFDFVLVPPFYTFAVEDTEYLLTFFGLFAVGFVISELAGNLRDQAESAERRRIEIVSLYGLSRDLAAASSLESILQAITDNIAHTFDREVVIFLPDRQGTLRPTAATPEYETNENELAVAEWAFEHNQPAGRGTDTLPAAAARYLPLATAGSRIGVLAVRPRDPDRHLPPEGYRLLEAFASQAAAALARVQLAERAQQAQLLEATERLQSALLNSLSHDLRTPLVSITGALTSLDEQSDDLNAEDRQNLIQTARGEAARMNRLVGNLLSMSRIESGALFLRRRPEELADLVEKARELLGRSADAHPIRTSIPEDFPQVPVDFALMVQVLVNLLDNAVKYSPPNSPVDVSAGQDGTTAHLEVADRGVGIPAEERVRVFDKFHRVQGPDNVRGSGLGLSICKGIVEAHGGKIFAQPRAGGGTVIAIELPLQE